MNKKKSIKVVLPEWLMDSAATRTTEVRFLYTTPRRCELVRQCFATWPTARKNVGGTAHAP